MRTYLATGAVLLASLAGSSADSNTAVTFNKFLGGSYEMPSSIGTDGSCPKVTTPYSSSPIAPLDEELSIVWRGPGQLMQVAVYKKDDSTAATSKRSIPARRGHRHFHERNLALRRREAYERLPLEKRVCGAEVVTAEGSWKNTYGCTAAELAALNLTPASVAGAVGAVAAAAAAPVAAALEDINPGAGNWGRVASYDSVSGTSGGLTFLANNNWNTNYGIANFLGYTAADGKTLAGSSTNLGNVTFDDGEMIIISSNNSCSDGTCGATAPGAQAYHGFAGEEKMFLFEYTMPLSGKRGFPYADAPALWMLNSKIVNIQQFNPCSPWATGAGELDLHEVINSGDLTGVSALHMGNNYAGTPDSQHPRPTSGSQKLAAIMTNGVVHVQILPDDVTFDEVVDAADITSYLDPSSGSMLFAALPMKK